MKPGKLRTWIEIDKKAIRHNAREFFNVIGQRPALMAVVKSNAYGHGLVAAASALAGDALFAARGWFGVDSIVEALRLRREGIKNPILVLGHTLPERLSDASRGRIAVTISTNEALLALARQKKRPSFHIKVDSGMHRQGFYPEEVPHLLKALKKAGLSPQGMYTHFASAKDREHPAYTLKQLGNFTGALAQFRDAGFTDIIRHASATGGTLLYPEAHLDMVRVGMGLYGYYPSPEAEKNLAHARAFGLKPVALKPVLAWKTVVAEVKGAAKGEPVGYDCTEHLRRDSTLAVLPIGYWHGFDRGLSGVGEVLIGGRRRRVLGRVSMDMIVVDVTDAPKVRVGETVVVIGEQARENMVADELSAHIGTSPYEFLTRINPLIKRIVS